MAAAAHRRRFAPRVRRRLLTRMKACVTQGIGRRASRVVAFPHSGTPVRVSQLAGIRCAPSRTTPGDLPMPKASNSGVRRHWPRTLGLAMSIATATVLAGAGNIAQAVSANDTTITSAKIDPALLSAVSRGESPAVLVKFRGEADLSSAFGMTDGDARATWVYETLKSFADQKQAQVRQTLAGQFQLSEAAHQYTVLWIDNSIAIGGMTAPMLDALRSAPNVTEIRLQREIPLPVEPEVETPPWTTFAIETNLTHIQVPDVWALGFKGAGIVVANIDTGVRHTHQSLVGKYRGNLG